MPACDGTAAFNPRFQGTYFVRPREGVQSVRKNYLSIPVFRGLTLLALEKGLGRKVRRSSFNPRFQGTYFVRQVESYPSIYRGIFQSPFSGDLLC